MSVSTVGSNTSSIADLLNQRRQNLQAMEAAVQSGNLGAAQQALTSVQGDTASLQASTTDGSNTDGSSQGGNPYRSSLATDLTSLSSALQSGDTTQAQAALTSFQTDLASAPQGTQAAGGAHHGHHHHGGGGASASSSQEIADSLFGTGTSSSDATSTDTTSSTDPFASAASSTSGDVLSQLLASLETSPSTSGSS